MEYGLKIKDYVIDIEELSYYYPHTYENEFFIYIYFKRTKRYFDITFKDESERNFYLKKLNEECVEYDVDQEFKDNFQINISEV